MATLADIKSQLEKPFDLEDIDFLPKGQFERDGKVFITGFPFADPRVYQNRLDTVCPGEWSTPTASVTIAGNKIITLVTVVICGVPHTDIGEASLDGPTKENAGTESWSQAFKRACSQAGLGRFLYSLDKAFLPYDKQRKRIDLDANALRAKARELYVKAGIIQRTNNNQAQPTSNTPNQSQTTGKPAEQPAQENAAQRPQARTQQAPTKPAEQKPAQQALPANTAPTVLQPNAERPYLPFFSAGREKGLWSDFTGFCKFATAELGVEVNRDNVRALTSEQLAILDIAIKEEAPVKKTA